MIVYTADIEGLIAFDTAERTANNICKKKTNVRRQKL